MKTLALPPYNSFTHKKNKRPEKKVQPVLAVKQKIVSKSKSAVRWFNAEAPENLSVKESVIRAAFVITLPMLSAIDWTYGTHLLYFIAPAIFYLEVTAFTMNCPIKALFSHDSHPPRFE
ncbi:hypothetical protein [Mucilaginibacter paludis]|uniref:DUF2892 domain-containing protein n=1 Tax=Mucilaginibacter paludis DSM 18603 TaxID=714943 RepID=H1Y6D1_9SPHI|nr:hypothetical protein [Mucilaginibacter paludis]EHQ24879.1 hypothetical protein Mucpa_0698 [Mucilaginibacter paludis DSM 18603]